MRLKPSTHDVEQWCGSSNMRADGGRESVMTEEGTLSIIRREQSYQVRYASTNPHGKEPQPRVCPDEAQLRALLYQLGMEEATVTQAWADVQKGGMAVLHLVVSTAQLQACFQPAALSASA
jgi:hypothetical protein